MRTLPKWNQGFVRKHRLRHQIGGECQMAFTADSGLFLAG